MTLSDELHHTLKEHFHWNKARLDCFIGLLFALLRAQRIDLSKLAIAMEGSTADTSCYDACNAFFNRFGLITTRSHS